METPRKKRIVVVGGGFAGLNLVKHIDLSLYEVVVVDKHNYHSFPPLFYQVASAGLDPASICFPLRREFRKRAKKYYARKEGQLCDVPLKFNMAEVEAIYPETHTVVTNLERLHYDILVIAAGTVNNFFNMPELQEKVYTIKSTPEALRCRNDILRVLERASLVNASEQRKMLNFLVVGGGPTGVEIAGAIGEMKRYVMSREYPNIPQENLRITLVEGSGRLLGTMSDKASEQALKDLRQLMVDVQTGKVMKSYKDGTVEFADGSTMEASLVIWTAGVTGTPLNIGSRADASTAYRAHGNRFVVDGQCRVAGLEDVYAIGDIALMPDVDPAFPQGHPQLAQPAIQQGQMVGDNLNHLAAGHPEKQRTFRYVDKGSMATIGRNRAVVDMKHMHLSGFTAWLAWMFVHLVSLLGMRNKITVLINWIWAYCNYSTSLRLLIRPSKHPRTPENTAT